MPPDFWDGSDLPLEEQPLGDLKNWSFEVADRAKRLLTLIESILACTRSPEGITCKRMVEDLGRLGELREAESEIAAESEHLQERFGKRFTGVQTAWDQVLSAVQWTVAFMKHAGPRNIPADLLSVICVGKEKAPPNEGLNSDLTRFQAAFLKLTSSFSDGFPAIGGKPLSQADFVVTIAHLKEMTDQLEALRDWIDFKALENIFREQGLGELFANLASRASALRAGEIRM